MRQLSHAPASVRAPVLAKDAGFPPLEETEGQFGPLAEPLVGWMCLAECASDLAPGIGDVMRSAGLLVRTLIEWQAPDLGRQLTDILAGPEGRLVSTGVDETQGLSRPVVAATINHMLESTRLALSPALAARNLADSIHELDTDERELLSQLSDAAEGDFPAITGLTDGGGYDGITNQMLVSAGSRLASEAAGVPLPGSGDDQDGFYFGKAGSRWWLTASLELPRSIGGQHPVHCVRPKHSCFGDRIQVTQSTYQNLDVDGLQLGRVSAGEIRNGYRGTLTNDEADKFSDNVSIPIDYRSYVCRPARARTSGLSWRGFCRMSR